VSLPQNYNSEHLRYDVQQSLRARNVTLKVRRDSGLVVVVPKDFDPELVPQIVASRRAWVESQMQRFADEPGRFDVDWPPRSIELPALKRHLQIRYSRCQSTRLRLVQTGDAIEVQFPRQARSEHLAQLLINWLRELAGKRLPVIAADLAQTHGYRYNKIIIRAQKTRWGSYSSLGTLSLNYKLLFLPSRLMRHLILHELVHSVHMNHSSAFWNELQSVDPDARAHDIELDMAWQYLPPWIE